MIEIGDRPLTLQDLHQIIIHFSDVTISPRAIASVSESHSFLKEFSRDKVIYGINTGFGPMAQYKIKEEDTVQLQYNLIRSHCSGSGKNLSDMNVRATLMARLNSLLKGYSGVHEEVVVLLSHFINYHIYPVIKEHGGVGASGDLVQLAHLALGMIGEGEVSHHGKIIPAMEALHTHGLKPMNMHLREGIAIMNGTSAMTGIGIVNIIQARKLVEWSIVAASALNEIVESYDDHFSKELNRVKLHKGQRIIASAMRDVLKGSRLIKNRAENLYKEKAGETVFKDKIQEYYSLRCVPQILGPVYDTLVCTENILLDEVNSVNDNPVIDAASNNVYHGGNFHGDYVALEMDKLKIAIVKLSILAERQLNYLLNDNLNGKLPPFLNTGVIGLNFGLQGVQFTATSTVAENQTLAFPMYLHSISNNKDNQDVVSMGANAALLTQKILENTFEVMAIEYIAIIKAINYLRISPLLASRTRELFGDIENKLPVTNTDVVMYPQIELVKQYLMEVSPCIFAQE